LAGYRRIYNWAIEKLNTGFNGDLQKECRIDPLIPEWVQSIPGHQKQEACDEAFDAFRQARANGGQPRFKSCKSKSQTIQFKVGNYKNGTWYPRTTKGLSFKAASPMPQECEYGTELVYQRGNWYACIPQYVVPVTTGSDRVIALDPGNRAFLSGYDGENVLEIGKGDIGRINRLCSHLDNLISRMTKSSVKRQRYKMRLCADRIRGRIQALVKDLHNKVASMLVNSYKLIFLPTFETSQMVLKSSRKINKKSVRNMLTWSHAKFAQTLEQMAQRKGVILIRCNESYTSKTCTSCGYIHYKLGGSKLFACPHCGNKVLRDINGARNIMIRALQATAFNSNVDAIPSLIVR
jgi:putative transposase